MTLGSRDQGRSNAFLPLLVAQARPVTPDRSGGLGTCSGHRQHIEASYVPYSRAGRRPPRRCLIPGSRTKWQTGANRLRGVNMTEVQSERAGPTVRRMLVGAKLRRLRTDMGLSREEAAEAIRASEWKIHRLENGQVGFKERDIIDLLRHYGDVLPPWFRTYVDLESAATLIRTYEGQFVPGLLQTDDYMRALVRAPTWRSPPRRSAAGSGSAWPARPC